MSLMQSVTKSAPALPSRVYLYAAEKWGKTSWAAFAPEPIFVMTQGETGLLPLIESGQVPETAHFPNDCKSWDELNDQVLAILQDKHNFRTLVLDTANGAERLLQAHVLQHEFKGFTTGKSGYNSYGEGDRTCMPYWTNLLAILDQIREKRRMSIILLAHSKIRTANNPEGEDYDQLRPEGVERLWPLTHKWADVIMAGTFDLVVKDEKAKAGSSRVLRCQPSGAVVAGNRYGLPAKITGTSESPKALFDAFASKLSALKKKPTPPANTPVSTTPQQTPVQSPVEQVLNEVHQASEAVNPPPKEEDPEIPSTTPAEAASEKARLVAGILEVGKKKRLTWPGMRSRIGEVLPDLVEVPTNITDLTINELKALSLWVADYAPAA